MSELPLTPADPASPPPLPKAPGILQALGLIVLYFVLQIGASAVVGFTVGIVEKIRNAGLSHAQVYKHVMHVLQQADNNALLVVLALPFIALILFWLVHRSWPVLWTMAAAPGFGLANPTSARWYVAALLIGLLMPPLGAVITQMLAHGHQVTQNVEELSRHASNGLRVPLAMVAITVGPLVEELLFRGVLLSALMRRLPVNASVAICAVLFGAVHLGGLDFQWYALPNLMLLAAALCWLRLASTSLWPAVVAHGMYNLFALVALFSSGS